MLNIRKIRVGTFGSQEVGNKGNLLLDNKLGVFMQLYIKFVGIGRH